MSNLLRNIILALGLALIVWLGYTVFFDGSEDLVIAENGTSDAAQQGQEFLALVQQVRAVQLNGAVLTDGRFKSLVDLREEIREEPFGRTNPFSPVTR